MLSGVEKLLARRTSGTLLANAPTLGKRCGLAETQNLPLLVPLLEQHPNSSQAFFPVTAERFLIVVAPQEAGGSPDIAQAEAFIGQRSQGINYHAGVWHAPIVALDAGGDFLMLIWEQDTPADCRIERLAAPLRVASDRP